MQEKNKKYIPLQELKYIPRLVCKTKSKNGRIMNNSFLTDTHYPKNKKEKKVRNRDE
jgi:hypothetical protein